MGIKNFSVRMDDEILKKLRVVAAHEGRSVNSELLFLIQNAVEDYESKHDKTGGHEVYTVTRSDAEGNTTKDSYKKFCYAIGQLLFYIYNPSYGDYTITFTRKRGE